MRKLAIPFFAGLALALSSVASADQTDPQLEEIFDVLQQTADTQELRVLQGMIWSLWRIAPEDEVQNAFDAGLAAMRGADFRAAIDLFTDAIDIEPDFAEAYNMRATTHFMLGNDAQSLADVQKVLDLEPRHFGALMGGVQISLRLEQPDLALEFAEEALDLMPYNQGYISVAERLRGLTGTIDL